MACDPETLTENAACLICQGWGSAPAIAINQWCIFNSIVPMDEFYLTDDQGNYILDDQGNKIVVNL